MEAAEETKIEPRYATPGAHAWQLMYETFRASKPYLEVVASAFNLTVQQMFALKQLGNDRPLAMSELALSLGCDASNVTSLVDKLESRGLVERRSADRDRRVKALFMTPAGLALQDSIEERMQQPPPAIGNLSFEDQRLLCQILERALESLG
ncbi:MAG: MarR family transcriptional regulator [Candidatus Eremiobacteraeota bacterium]|nr:MarR family transcriptional regulator [Candidatus Eremiobacteraeota bacterium]